MDEDRKSAPYPAPRLHEEGLATGEEARVLERLLEARVPVAHGVLVYLTPQTTRETLQECVATARQDGPHVLLRPFYPAARLGDCVPEGTLDVGESDVGPAFEVLRGLLDEGANLLEGSLPVRIVGAETLPGGAASADVVGDPDGLSVWARGERARPWRIDRRSGRSEQQGEGLDIQAAERIADLVDRAQLELGIPVEIEWVQQKGRPVVLTLLPLTFDATFADGLWRRVALVAADEGTVAPLAIDTLDRAFSTGEPGPSVQAAVRRVYARPYHRRNPGATLGRRSRRPFARASAEVATATKEAAPVIAASIRYERAMSGRLAALDRPVLAELDDEAVLGALRERQRFVAEGYLLLDNGREITRRTLEAMEALIGVLPRECYPALAAPYATRQRRKWHATLLELAEAIQEKHGALVPRESLETSLHARWDQVREEMLPVRPLGIDVTPVAIGATDESFLAALRRVGRRSAGHEVREMARAEAEERVEKLAHGVGRLRGVMAASLTILLGRIARAKGGVAEGVSAGLGRLREGGLEVGRRLVEQAILDDPEDALYLSLDELGEALRGEPGAYAARVRLRREDDQRWANYSAPRRLGS